MNDPKNLAHLRKKAQTEPNRLTDEERLAVYGAGNPNVVRYAARDGVVVSRMFRAGDPVGPEWKDSPAQCGAAESHPGRAPDGFSPDETVVAYLDPAQQPATPAKVLSAEELAAVAREPASGISSPPADYGDTDDGQAGPGADTGRPLRRHAR